MAIDEGLAQRIREQLDERAECTEKKMFGGLCFLVGGHMCCGILGDSMIARVGPDAYEDCLQLEHSTEMDFTGRPMKGMVQVSADGLAEDQELANWLDRCLAFVSLLPPKSSTG